jgi:hypothetical protein
MTGVVPTASAVSSTLTIRSGNTSPVLPYLIGDAVVPDPANPARRFDLRRCDVAGDCFTLQNQPVRTVLSPDGRYVLYDAFETGGILNGTATPVPGTKVTPSIRLLDLQTGQDRLFAVGAWRPVWGTDGRLAYTRGDVPSWTLDEAYPSRIVVRESLAAPEEVWTAAPDSYTCLAWAGPRLICQHGGYPPGGQPFPDALLVFTGPGVPLVLAPREVDLVAVSPDGSRALVTSLADQADFIAVVHLVDLTNGRDLSTLKLPASLENLAMDGDWLGDHVVAARGWSPGGAMHPRPGLAILDVAGDRLALADVYEFGPRELLGGGPFLRVDQPRAVGGDPEHLALWFGSRGYLDCRLDLGQCVLGPEQPGPGEFLGIPSRPSGKTP